MRLYGGRILKNSVNRQVARAQEMRDAIIVDINTTDKYCRVKIQGSDAYVRAWYPENWEATPSWLKPGNAVRITHPGGNRGRIEVAGHGILLPTTTGNLPVVPDPPALEDTILSGCAVIPADPPGMCVIVQAGAVRIDEMTYSLAGLQMDAPEVEMDRPDLLMDETSASVAIDAASATKFRYDSIVIGTDGIAEVVKGSEFLPTGTIPDPPDAPVDHLRAGFILIPPGCTAITGGLINKYYTAPVAVTISAVAVDDELAWEETSTTIRIAVKDQYGNYVAAPIDTGWHFLLSWVRGNGTLSYGGLSHDETASFPVLYSGATYASVTYTRDNTSGNADISPFIAISETNPILGQAIVRIQLLNETGEKLL